MCPQPIKGARFPKPSAKASPDRYSIGTQPVRIQSSFYNTQDWKEIRIIKLNRDPLCEHCFDKGLYVPANVVHHKQEIRLRPDLARNIDNLQSLCPSCHAKHHHAQSMGNRPRGMPKDEIELR